MQTFKGLLLLIVMSISTLSAKSSVVELNSKNFQETLNNNSMVLVTFSAPWCSACKKMQPNYEKVAQASTTQTVFATVNTDNESKLSQKYKINNVPTTVLFKNGKEFTRYVGGLDVEEIELFVNPKKILNKHKNLCNANEAESCQKLGVIYEEGMGIENNQSLAVEYYLKACALKDIDSCFDAGYLYDMGKGLPENNQEAIRLYRKSCDENHRVGCHNLALMYEDGEGTKADGMRAMQLYEKACKLEYSDSCYNLALIYEKGKIVKKDLLKAKELYTISCNDGDEDACNEVKNLSR